MGSKYVPLTRLVDDWAEQGGELEATVLANLCAYEARGRLPAEAFRYAGSGEPLARGALSELVGLARSSGYRIVQEDTARDLRAVVVSKTHLLKFCRANSIRPPRCVAGARGWLVGRAALHRSPPQPEPAADELEQEEAARVAAEARRNAEVAEEIEVALSWMQHCLARLRGEHTAPGDSSGLAARRGRDRDRAPEPPELWGFLCEHFAKCASTARFYLDGGGLTDASRLAELRARFDALDAEYASRKRELQAVGASSGSGRRRGRPPESGSLKPADAPLVEEMWRLIEADPTLAPTAAALRVVDRAAGAGTTDSKAKRLAQRYSEKYGRSKA